MIKSKKIKKIIKPAVEELEKIGETAKKQIIGKQEAGESVMVEVMTHSDGRTGEVSPEEERKMRREELRGLERVKEEAEKESKKTEEKGAARLQGQQEVIQQPGEPFKELVEPPTKPARGAPPGGPAGRKGPEVRKRQ
jgi:hypothetical protein